MRQSRPRGQVRRTQILEAATAVFLEKGYAGATIDLVVKRAGASNASIYNFFGGKDGLFAAIIEDYTGHLLDAFQTIDVPTDADVPAALTQIGRQYLEIALTPNAVALCRLIMAEGIRFPELAETYYRRGLDRIITHVAGIFATWHSRGFVTMDDPALTAAQFLDAVGGGLIQRVVAGLPPDDWNTSALGNPPSCLPHSELGVAVERRIRNAVEIFGNATGPRKPEP